MKEGSDNKFLEAERQVFAGYSLTPKARRVKLRKPALTLRVLELGSGEPALFLHGMGGAAVHWASLMSQPPRSARRCTSARAPFGVTSR
jgi:hypothetical protein